MIDRFLFASRYGLGVMETRGAGPIVHRIPSLLEPYRILRLNAKKRIKSENELVLSDKRLEWKNEYTKFPYYQCTLVSAAFYGPNTYHVSA